jgi:hypothetical protein
MSSLPIAALFLFLVQGLTLERGNLSKVVPAITNPISPSIPLELPGQPLPEATIEVQIGPSGLDIDIVGPIAPTALSGPEDPTSNTLSKGESVGTGQAPLPTIALNTSSLISAYPQNMTSNVSATAAPSQAPMAPSMNPPSIFSGVGNSRKCNIVSRSVLLFAYLFHTAAFSFM